MVKRMCFIVIYCIISALLLPMVIFAVMQGKGGVQSESITPEKIPSEQIEVFFHETGEVKSMDIEKYLCGVVSAEMPAEFETEALKAQAVAARSYAIHRKLNPSNEHPGASVCTDYAHCKAYKTDEELAMAWGEDNKKYSEKIQTAVYSTKGEVITYKGEVALAVFHSQSGNGRTESSKDVWGGDVPYLVSVESHGEEGAPNFYSTASFSFDEFVQKIKTLSPSCEINSFDDIGVIEKSDGGSVRNITIGKEKFSGKDIRSLFNLRSSCFDIKKAADNVVFEVTGYGHGVGMSQYGANAMAKEGKTYKEILTHYYSGTKVEGV